MAFINVPPSYQAEASKAAEPPAGGKEKGGKKKAAAAEPVPLVEATPAARLVVLRVSGQTARAFASLDSSRAAIASAKLSADGLYLSVATADGAVSLYKVPPNDDSMDAEGPSEQVCASECSDGL